MQRLSSYPLLDKSLKHLFTIPQDKLYFCAHSLGLMPLSAIQSVNRCLLSWKERAVEAWDLWMDLPSQIGAQIALLIGASANEVIVADNTTVNLYKVLHQALQLNRGRRLIVIEEGDFPTNRYIAQQIAKEKQCQLKQITSERLADELSADIAVLLLTHVNYRSSAIHDMKAITQRAHELGIVVIFDLSHSVGVLPLALSLFDVDFAVGCTYKYLNGGPGAPSFIYVHAKYHEQLHSPIAGWMSHRSPFDFAETYQPARGMRALLTGTPSIVGMSALTGSLEVYSQLHLTYLRQKSCALSQYFIELLGDNIRRYCITSSKAEQRGSHVAFKHPCAETICRSLLAQGIICDYRPPELIRFGFSPLYHDSEDIELAATAFLTQLRRMK